MYQYNRQVSLLNSKQRRERSFNKFYLFMVFFIFGCYAVIDINTSSNFGFGGSSRTLVYVCLVGIIGTMWLYNSIFQPIKLEKGSIPVQLILLTLWMVIVSVYNGTNMWFMLKYIGMSVWWIVAYIFFKNYITHNPDDMKKLIKYFTAFMLFYFVVSIFAQQKIQVAYGKEYATVNFSYYIIVYLPIITFIKNQKTKNLFTFLIILAIMISVKRGAIVVLPAMILGSMITKGIMEEKSLSYFMRIVGFVLLFAVLAVAVNAFTDNFLFSRFEIEDLKSGSGRDEIYERIIRNLKSRGPVKLIFGGGVGATVNDIGIGAHNEWLEFTYDFGIGGVALYFVLLLKMCKNYLLLLREKSKYAPSYIMALLFMFFVGLYGAVYFSHYTFTIMAFLGLVDGVVSNEKRKGGVVNE